MSNLKSIKEKALLKANKLGIKFKGVRIDDDGEIIGFCCVDGLRNTGGIWHAPYQSKTIGYFCGGNKELEELNLELIKLDVK